MAEKFKKERAYPIVDREVVDEMEGIRRQVIFNPFDENEEEYKLYQEQRKKDIKVEKIRVERIKLKKRKKMHSITTKKGRVISSISYYEFIMMFTGKTNSMKVLVNGRVRRIIADEVRLAYNGEYLSFSDFAELYDDEDGDFPINNAIHNSVVEAIYEPVTRTNKDTKKDRMLKALERSTSEQSEVLRKYKKVQ